MNTSFNTLMGRAFSLLAAIVMLNLNTGHAQSVSGISGSFVDIGPGTRMSSLGNAFVGLADDPSALYTNPAGMAYFDKPSLMVMSTDQYGLVTSNFVSAAVPLSSKNMTFALGAISSGDDLMQETTFQGAYSMRFGKLAAGLSVKARFSSFGNNTLSYSDYEFLFSDNEINEGLSNQVSGTGNGFGFDLGLMYELQPGTRFGIALRDPVAPFNWSSETQNPDKPAKGDYNEALPLSFAVGGSTRLAENWLITFEYQPGLMDDQDDALRAGVEAKIMGILAVRAGTEQWSNTFDDDKYMAGVGLITPEVRGFSLQVDYGYVIDPLANSHRFGVILNFPSFD